MVLNDINDANLCQFNNQLADSNIGRQENMSSLSSQDENNANIFEESQHNVFNHQDELPQKRSLSNSQSSCESEEEEINTNEQQHMTRSQILDNKVSLDRNTQFYIQKVETSFQHYDDYQNGSTKLLEQIQLLNYKGRLEQLEQHFKTIIDKHITFNDCLPCACSQVGQLLIQDGLFHELWGMILKRKGKEECFYVYYDALYSIIKVNHSNFQNMFNSVSFSSDVEPYIANEEQSSTRLTKKNQKQKIKSSQSAISSKEDNQNSLEKGRTNDYDDNGEKMQQNLSLNLSQKCLQPTQEIQILQLDSYGCGQRVRLLKQPQSNSRRIKMEQACYFFGINKVYLLQQIQIAHVLQFQTGSDAQFAVVQAHMASYSEQFKKVVIDIRPKTLLLLSNFINFSQLLRLKLTYNVFDGFVYYEQLLDLGKWLRSSQLLEYGIVSRK